MTSTSQGLVAAEPTPCGSDADAVWWRERLAGAAPTTLGTCPRRAGGGTARDVSVLLPVLDARETTALGDWAAGRDAALSTVLLAGFCLVAAGRGAPDVLISTLAGASPGPAAAPVLLRVAVPPDAGLEAVTAAVGDAVREARAHAAIPEGDLLARHPGLAGRCVVDPPPDDGAPRAVRLDAARDRLPPGDGPVAPEMRLERTGSGEIVARVRWERRALDVATVREVVDDLARRLRVPGTAPPSSPGRTAPVLPLLEQMPPDERARILAASRRAAAEVDPWLAERSPGHRRLSWPVALLVAATLPEVPAPTLALLVRYGCWIFLLDDAFDEQELDEATFTEYTAQLRDAARGVGDPPRLPAAVMLAALRAELGRLPLFTRLGEEWADALDEHLGATAVDRVWRRRFAADGCLPSFDEYIRVATAGAIMRFTAMTAIVALDDPTVLDAREELRAASVVLARCVRLDNDLCTHEKERAEGGITAIDVLCAQGAGDAEAASALVRDDVADGLARLEARAAHPATVTGRAERWMHDCARFLHEFYARHEFRTLAPEE